MYLGINPCTHLCPTVHFCWRPFADEGLYRAMSVLTHTYSYVGLLKIVNKLGVHVLLPGNKNLPYPLHVLVTLLIAPE